MAQRLPGEGVPFKLSTVLVSVLAFVVVLALVSVLTYSAGVRRAGICTGVHLAGVRICIRCAGVRTGVCRAGVRAGVCRAGVCVGVHLAVAGILIQGPHNMDASCQQGDAINTKTRPGTFCARHNFFIPMANVARSFECVDVGLFFLYCVFYRRYIIYFVLIRMCGKGQK